MSATGQIVVEDSSLRIDGIGIHNPDVAQFFHNKPEGERLQVLVRAVELGVFCLQRAEVGQNLDFVRLEVERLIQASTSAVRDLPEAIRVKLSGQDSPTAQISATVNSVQSAMREKLDEVRGLFDTHLDPSRSDATLCKALAGMSGLLDPRRDDSVQKRIEATVQSLSGADGTIPHAVRTAVEGVVAPLRTAVETLSLAIAKQAGTQEANAASPEKGIRFEEELLPMLQTWAASVGADLEYTAPQNQPGDFTLTLGDMSVSGLPLRIVIEARDRAQAFGRVQISRQMTEALSRWKGTYGIYVSKTRNGLAQGIGEWCEFGCEHGPVVACTAEHLKTALRFALVETRLRTAAERDHEIDPSTLSAELGRFRSSLNHLTQIKRKVGDIRQILEILPAIETEADQMRNEMQDALGKIEGLLPR